MAKRKRKQIQTNPRMGKDDLAEANERPVPSKRFLGRAGLLLLVLIVSAASWRWFRATPDELLRKAKQMQDTNPVVAEDLFLQSIEESGGDFPAAQIQLCEFLVAQQRWVEARGAFSLIQDPTRCDAAVMVRIAQQSLAGGETILAQLSAQGVAKASPHRAAALRVLIELNQRMEHDPEVRELAKELSALAPADPVPWQALARSYRKSQEMDPAIEAARRVIALSTSPEQASPWRENLLDWLLQVEDVAAARREFDAIPAAAKNSADCLLKQARLLRLEGNFEAAMNAVDQALGQEPQSIGALMLRGVLALDLDQPEQAVKDLEASLKSQPLSKESHYKLSQAYRRLGRTTEARQHLAESQRLNKLSEEILVLERQIQQEPADRERLVRLSALHAQLGHHEAARYWQDLAEHVPVPR